MDPEFEDQSKDEILEAIERDVNWIRGEFKTEVKSARYLYPSDKDRSRKWVEKATKDALKMLKTKFSVNTKCICSNNMQRDLKTLKGNMLLDVLTLIINVIAFHVPFNGYPTIPTIMNVRRRGSISNSMDRENSQKKTICQSNTHTLHGIRNQHTLRYLIDKIRLVGQKKDVNSIRFYFMLAPRSYWRKLCDVLCVEERYHNLTIHTIAEIIKEAFRKTYASTYKISKIWLGSESQKRPVFTFFESMRQHKVSGFDTIVVVVKESTHRKTLRSLWGFDLILVSENVCNAEVQRLLQFDVQDPTEAIVKHVNEKKMSDLFKNHSNITLLNISNVRSQGFGTSSFRVKKTPTLVIHCHVKGVIPFGEDIFPEQVSGFQVDVREGTCNLAVQGLRMSENISADGCAKFGTLGGFVDLQNPPGRAFLTCAHVVLPRNTLQNQVAKEYVRKREIIRVFDKEKNEIGKITKAVFDPGQPANVSVDAALVEITDRHPRDGYFSDVSDSQLSGAGM